jgi:type I restriction enzyme M protein
MRREALQGQLNDYDIFMAQLTAVGHDKRGNTLYKRNEDGEEILPDSVQEETKLYETTSTGQVTRRLLPRQKQVDDDTPLVADEFRSWKDGTVLGW